MKYRYIDSNISSRGVALGFL